jgi:hypothetical protein
MTGTIVGAKSMPLGSLVALGGPHLSSRPVGMEQHDIENDGSE